MVPVSVFTDADSKLPITSTAPACPSISTLERVGIVTMQIDAILFAARAHVDVDVGALRFNLDVCGIDGEPVDFASTVIFFCCSSEATTLTRPSRFLTESDTFSGASSSCL